MGLHFILSEIMTASLDWSGHIVTILLFFFFLVLVMGYCDFFIFLFTIN